MSTNKKQADFYAQIGVAMTCRSYEEYVRMFNLDHKLLSRGPILDVAAGASSFTASAEERGYQVRAVDPLYAMSPIEIHSRGQREIEESTAKLASLAHILDWNYYGSIAHHKAGREAALEQFSQHFAKPYTDESIANHDPKSGSYPSHTDTYVPAYLPQLPFKDGYFSLVLCSHFLFLYSEQFDETFHEAALLELLRVCKPGGEVRVYPLLSLSWEPSSHLDLIMQRLSQQGVECRLEQSHLPFIPGSTHLLVLRALTTP